MDLKLIVASATSLFVLSHSGSGETDAYGAAHDSLMMIAFFYGCFFVIELVAELIGYRMARQSPLPLIWLLVQRFSYGQIMYGVVHQSLARAISGGRQGWGKLDRSGRVSMPS